MDYSVTHWLMIFLAGMLGGIFGRIILPTRKLKILTAATVSTTPVDPLRGAEEFLRDLREAVTDQILNHHSQLFDAIAKQRIILDNRDRDPVAIFLSEPIFKELVLNAVNTTQLDDNGIENLCSTLQELGLPIGHLGELPIYVTPLLTSAPVLVAGGINWTFANSGPTT